MALRNRRNSIVAALAVIALTGPAVAAADGAKWEKTAVKVVFEDLNIHSEAGARILYARLKRASRIACDVGNLRETGGLNRSIAASACYEAALSKAVEQIDSETLQDIHAG